MKEREWIRKKERYMILKTRGSWANKKRKCLYRIIKILNPNLVTKFCNKMNIDKIIILIRGVHNTVNHGVVFFLGGKGCRL